MPTRRYTAFISYRHADNTQEGRRWAEWLHRGLERYVVPPDLIGTPNLRGEPIHDSLYPIFRDEDELPANADLATGIRAALEVSDHLIVLCSPRSAVSPWVRKEVREFKELGRSDRILAIIIAGEPNADEPAKAREGILRDEECFCEELRFGAVRGDGTLDWTIRTEPLASDLRPNGARAEGFVTAEAYREHLTLNSSLTPDKIATRTDAYRHQLDHALIKVIAGLLGVPLGQLVDRDAAHRAELLRRAEAEAARLRASNRGLGVTAVVAVILAALAGWYWFQSNVQRDAALVAQASEIAQRQKAEEIALLANQAVVDATVMKTLKSDIQQRKMVLTPIFSEEDRSLSAESANFDIELTKGLVGAFLLGKVGLFPCSGEVVVSHGGSVIARSSFVAPQLLNFFKVSQDGIYTVTVTEKNGHNANIEIGFVAIPVSAAIEFLVLRGF